MTPRQRRIFEIAIINAIKVYGIDPRDARQERRTVWARAAVFVTMRRLTGLSYALIGEEFGKDHATVIYSIKKHKDHIEFDKEYKALFTKYEILTSPQADRSNRDIAIEEIRNDVNRINDDLRTMGFDWDYIEDFWRMSIETARKLKSA